jgi:hypothetical protein
MHGLRLARGLLMVCPHCETALRQGRFVDTHNAIPPDMAERVFDEICANCFDYNRPLIDDMLGSSE